MRIAVGDKSSRGIKPGGRLVTCPGGFFMLKWLHAPWQEKEEGRSLEFGRGRMHGWKGLGKGRCSTDLVLAAEALVAGLSSSAPTVAFDSARPLPFYVQGS